MVLCFNTNPQNVTTLQINTKEAQGFHCKCMRTSFITDPIVCKANKSQCYLHLAPLPHQDNVFSSQPKHKSYLRRESFDSHTCSQTRAALQLLFPTSSSKAVKLQFQANRVPLQHLPQHARQRLISVRTHLLRRKDSNGNRLYAASGLQAGMFNFRGRTSGPWYAGVPPVPRCLGSMEVTTKGISSANPKSHNFVTFPAPPAAPSPFAHTRISPFRLLKPWPPCGAGRAPPPAASPWQKPPPPRCRRPAAPARDPTSPPSRPRAAAGSSPCQICGSGTQANRLPFRQNRREGPDMPKARPRLFTRKQCQALWTEQYRPFPGRCLTFSLLTYLAQSYRSWTVR